MPFTVITGSLGAGKTSLLNHLLTGGHGRRLAVIVNDFGEINIDSQLIARSGNDYVLELTNGCVCCTVQEDLLRGLHDLLEARLSGRFDFDHLVMETTGLAKVGPIVQTVSAKTFRETVRISGIVTVVDAFHVLAQIDTFQEAGEQIGHADLVLLNKTDLVDDAKLSALTARLSAMNGLAEIKPCLRAKVDAAEALFPAAHREDAVSVNLNFPEGPGASATLLNEYDHSHTSFDEIRSFSIRLSEPLDHGRVQDWFSYLIMRYSERLLRYKGILHIEGLAPRIVVQGVHSLIEITSGREWRQDENRQTVVVFIGRNLPERQIRDGLAQCVAVERHTAE